MTVKQQQQHLSLVVVVDSHAGLLNKLFDNLTEIKSSRVLRAALWVIGDAATEFADVDRGLRCIKSALGNPPFVPADEEAEATDGAAASTGAAAAGGAAGGGAAAQQQQQQQQQQQAPASRPKVLADGTYATETDVAQTAARAAAHGGASADLLGGLGDAQGPVLRAQLLKGNFFVGAALAASLTKLAIRVSRFADVEPVIKHSVRAEVLLILVSMLRLGDSKHVARPIERDSRERLVQCANVLLASDPALETLFLDQTHASFGEMLRSQTLDRAQQQALDKQKAGASGLAQPDDLLVIRQLKGSRAAGQLELEAQVCVCVCGLLGGLAERASSVCRRT